MSLLPRNQRKFGQLQKNMGLHQAQVELRRLLPKGKAQTQMLNVCIVTRSSLIVSPAKFGFNAHSARNGPTRIVPGMRSETLNVKCVPKSLNQTCISYKYVSNKNKRQQTVVDRTLCYCILVCFILNASRMCTLGPF